MRCKRLVAWLPGCSVSWLSGSLVAPNELRATTYIVRRTALQIWQVSDSITISTNTHPIRTLTWAVSTSWADAANGPLARVNIYGIINFYSSGGYESDSTWREADGGGADSILQFQLKRGGDWIKHCQKMKRNDAISRRRSATRKEK
jgi:hypothetical protein